jgi:SET domain-containing protein
MDDFLKKIIDLENKHDLNLFLAKNKSSIRKDIIFSSEKKIIDNDEKPHIVETLDLYSSPTFIDKSSIHEYGVFADKYFKIDDIIETCYTIELEFRDKYHKDKTILDYAYALFTNDVDTTNHGNKLILLTGNGMLYNHDPNNNAEWKLINKERKAILVAIKDIEKKTEITINYGPGYWNRNK